MNAARRFPVQRSRNHAAGTVPWAIGEAAWRAYAAQYGSKQTADDIARRGGFGPEEMDSFAPEDWRDSFVKS